MQTPFTLGAALPVLMAAIAFGYLLGSIPFGLLLARAAGLGDVRTVGSGNIGATNVLRLGDKRVAAATLLLDGAKGAVAVLIAGYFAGQPAALAAGLGAVLGHVFPAWLKFKGGKGVATTLGVLLAVSWPLGLLGMVLWLAIAVATRLSSLSALLALALVAATAWATATSAPFGLVLSNNRIALLATLLAVLVWAMHHENIRRLLKGEEPRIGQSKA
jgi:glycerol-3-phosphate acyltransferase PlsY